MSTLKKSTLKKLLVATLLGFAGIAMATFSKNTTQMPHSVTIEAKAITVDGKQHVEVTWTDPMQVLTVEHYIGHGVKSGMVKTINVGAAKKVVLEDVAKNGSRFNVKLVGGRFLHLECGGNRETTMPTFKGLKVDCDFTDKASGQKVGALVAE
ncbi:MAG: hypothetical protein Q8O53_00675 [Candidatus Moranbacteria bacterium]|nr:hypothetical protein [Candidatus Moranbacteria bacterium]